MIVDREQSKEYRVQRNEIWRLCAVLWFCVFVVTGCAKREIKNIDSGGKNIICFGDSITFGYGVNRGEDYPSALAKMVTLPVINAGIDGDTSIEAFLRLEFDVLQRQPLLVIVEFGGNDFLRRIPLEETKKNIKKMVERIQTSGSMVAVVDISSGLLLSQYREVFSNIAKEEEAIFIPDVLNGIITNPKLKSDFMHPNVDGYKIIAHRIYRAVTPYLNQNLLARKKE